MRKNNLFLLLLGILLFFPQVFAEESSFGNSIVTNSYSLSREVILREVTYQSIFSDYLVVENFLQTPLEITLSVSDELKEFVDITTAGLIIPPKNKSEATFLIKGIRTGEYSGKLILSGDIKQEIPINLTILDISLNPEFLVESSLEKNKFFITKNIDFIVYVNKLKPIDKLDVNFTYSLVSTDKEYFLGAETLDILSSFQLVKRFKLSEDILEGNYILLTSVQQANKSYTIYDKQPVIISKPFLQRKLFGIIPMWLIVLIGSILGGGLLAFILIRNSIEAKKKYKMKLDKKSLPKKDPHFFALGQIAESDFPVFLEPNRLTTHSIVAGATGGGKSIAAQVIVEEALMKNIAVVVFDPTAQWSGMLRKCEDKRMIALYPKFGLKPTDAKGFPGNIRQVMDARQIIEINKHIHPGQIQVFSLNKLDPHDMDIFVANVIRQIFRSDPKEFPDLRVLFVFDEVHRLLPKFGGSGEGFLQIERACREFRKWGLGVLLVSQVLSDFVGEIKANINTEIQMRTRDEGDLNRIKVKYGEDFLKSLVKASVGAGMVVNPAYNHASPYFVQFRPILHNTRRLSDEELLKYNNYNDVVDDLEYQVEQLEAEKVDTFDLKMELKLVKDKMMIGNFSVVDIYLEGLKPRIVKQWEKLGKTPKKKELQLADLDEIKKSVEEAKKQREKLQKEEDKTKQEKALAAEVLEEKILPKPLTFDNGVMVSSLKELKGVLSTLDDDIFKIHVNDQKNEVVDFISQLFPDKTDALKALKTKEELYKAIEPLGKKEQKA